MRTEWSKAGYKLRLAQKQDAEPYFRNNFNPLDSETARLTGSQKHFELDKVISFFYQCLDASDRYDFMIISPEGKIIGESVINEIDNDLRSANFRICLFHRTDYGKGIGTWALEKTRDFAFQELHLHRLELNVFSFNVRAIKAYKHAGFRQEGILKDAIKDGDKYADNILMAILEDEWKSCK